jgi:hypothetical protein
MVHPRITKAGIKEDKMKEDYLSAREMLINMILNVRKTNTIPA